MFKSLEQVLHGYRAFRAKYAIGDESLLQQLSNHGQRPQVMVVACSDSRVDPAVILQSGPGDLFVVRNVANIVPPYEPLDQVYHHGTSAALEFGICYLNVKHLILLGHSQCAGIQYLFDKKNKTNGDFINKWISIIKVDDHHFHNADDCSKFALQQSLKNVMGFPWVRQKLATKELNIHLWFFDIRTGEISVLSQNSLWTKV